MFFIAQNFALVRPIIVKLPGIMNNTYIVQVLKFEIVVEIIYLHMNLHIAHTQKCQQTVTSECYSIHSSQLIKRRHKLANNHLSINISLYDNEDNEEVFDMNRKSG